jgi:hypothetical protein
VKFLVLLAEEDHYASWDKSSDADRKAFYDGLRAFDAAVEERGRVVGGDALQHPSRSRRVSGPPGERIVTTGPYAESVEQIGGFYVVELPDLETALETAKLLPSALVDVVPIEELPEV